MRKSIFFAVARMSCIAAVALIGNKPLSAQDFGPTSPYPLEGWQTLKFGMSPRQTCNAMNQIGLKCDIEMHPTREDCDKAIKQFGMGDLSALACKTPPSEKIMIKEKLVKIGEITWLVNFDFANGPRPSDDDFFTAGVDRGNLTAIDLRLCGRIQENGFCSGELKQCQAIIESLIGVLERQYGPFWRDPDLRANGTHYGDAVKKFTNDNLIQVMATHFSTECLDVHVHYSNPNVQRSPPPRPPAPTGHF